MISRFFIDRPIFATVISVVISLAGLAALNKLPLAQYPNLTPPTVSVSAAFGGVGDGPHDSLGHPSGMPDSPHRTPVPDWFSKVISEGGASRAAAGPAREAAGGSIHKPIRLKICSPRR